MKIPKAAKRIFKGALYEVWQWPQKLFDGTTDKFEMLKRVGTVIIFAEAGGKIIVQKQKQPHTKWFLCMPAGRMDKRGESAKQAALRELLEETGYRPRTIRLYKKTNLSHHIDHEINIFIARGCKKVAEPELDGGEKIITRLYAFEQFLGLWKNDRFFGGDAKEIIIRAKLDKNYQKVLKQNLLG